MNNTIAKVFEEIASAIESGSFAPKKKVALTTLGSEHGEETLLEGAKLAKKEAAKVIAKECFKLAKDKII